MPRLEIKYRPDNGGLPEDVVEKFMAAARAGYEQLGEEAGKIVESITIQRWPHDNWFLVHTSFQLRDPYGPGITAPVEKAARFEEGYCIGDDTLEVVQQQIVEVFRETLSSRASYLHGCADRLSFLRKLIGSPISRSVLPLPCGNCGHRTTRKGDRYGCTHCGAEVVPLPSAA